jgi:hypothetical protein
MADKKKGYLAGAKAIAKDIASKSQESAILQQLGDVLGGGAGKAMAGYRAGARFKENVLDSEFKPTKASIGEEREQARVERMSMKQWQKEKKKAGIKD